METEQCNYEEARDRTIASRYACFQSEGARQFLVDAGRAPQRINPPLSSFCSRGGTYPRLAKQNDHILDMDRRRKVIQDIALVMAKKDLVDNRPLPVRKEWKDIEEAINDLTLAISGRDDDIHHEESASKRGLSTWDFFRDLAESDIFVSEYWHRCPLLIRGDDITSVKDKTTS
jgi:hypothetical protein